MNLGNSPKVSGQIEEGQPDGRGILVSIPFAANSPRDPKAEGTEALFSPKAYGTGQSIGRLQNNTISSFAGHQTSLKAKLDGSQDGLNYKSHQVLMEESPEATRIAQPKDHTMERQTTLSNEDNPLLQLGLQVTPIQSLQKLQHVDIDAKNQGSTKQMPGYQEHALIPPKLNIRELNTKLS